jgi:hypothetical protein
MKGITWGSTRFLEDNIKLDLRGVMCKNAGWIRLVPAAGRCKHGFNKVSIISRLADRLVLSQQMFISMELYSS